MNKRELLQQNLAALELTGLVVYNNRVITDAINATKAELAKQDANCDDCAYLGKVFGLPPESYCLRCINQYDLVDRFTPKEKI